jgi:chromosome segregation ATPase
MLEQDKDYHEENYKRANNDIFNLRAQMNQLQEENDEVSNQLYYKTQELSKLQYSVESYKTEIDELNQRSEEAYRMRTEIFSLKSDISNLQEEIFNREAANARLSNEINYVRSQSSELEEELDVKQEYLSKLNYEYSSIKSSHEEFQLLLDEKDKLAQKLSNDLNSFKNKYRDLEEEMEEREQAFSILSQELSKLKGNLSYYEDDIEERNIQLAKVSNEKELLKAEIMRLNDTISDKNQEINRAKQEVFNIRLEAGERDYAEKMRIDQELYSFRNKITILEHEVEDKDSDIRRLHIELDSVRHQPVTEPAFSEEEVQELRNELGKKQRELINMRFDLEDRQYQLETSTNNANMLKNTLSEYQERLLSEREEFEGTLKESSQRERRLQQEISLLNEELERKNYVVEPTPKPSFLTTYS